MTEHNDRSADIVDRLREPVMLRYNAEQVNAERRESADAIVNLRQQITDLQRHITAPAQPAIEDLRQRIYRRLYPVMQSLLNDDGLSLLWAATEAVAKEITSQPLAAPVETDCDTVKHMWSQVEKARADGTFSSPHRGSSAGNATDITVRLREPVMLRYNAEQINAERREAANEIDRLRLLSVPPQSVLWCCHARGPDDVYAAPDYATALAWSDTLNAINWSKNSMLKINDPSSWDECLIKAAPALWPHSAQAHAEDLPRSIEGFSLPLPRPESK